MAGTVTTTEQALDTMRKVTFDWTSSDGGAADATTTKSYSGIVWRVVLIPDEGDTQPDNLYDVVLNDDDDIDILAGAGADASNTAGEQIGPAIGAVSAISSSKLTLGVTNAGAANGGKVIVYIR